jgi:hypothetical protein
MTGGFPVRILASVKMRSRLGVRCAEMQPVRDNVSRSTASVPALTILSALLHETRVRNKGLAFGFWFLVFGLLPF